MNEFEKRDTADGFFGTGSTRPPKSYGGVVAFLLILVTVMGSIISLLSIWNVQLFQQLENTQQPQQLAELFHDEAPEAEPVAPISQYRSDQGLELNASPRGQENQPMEQGLSLQQIYAQCVDTVVSITAITPQGQITGSGVVVTKDGYIVTNSHVIDGAQTLWVGFTDGRELTAQLVGQDAFSDLAVLYVEANALKAADFGDSDALRVGDVVVAIGDPMGPQLTGSMTDGIVSAINRQIVTDGRSMTLIQTNAALNEGNSGGPLINCYGQVVGINTMKMGAASGSSTSVEGLGFAIPSRTVKTVVDQLIRQGYVSGRPTLELEARPVSTLYQRLYGLPSGLCVTYMPEDSAARQAGLQPGDVIMWLNGQRLQTQQDLQNAVNALTPGQRVPVVYYRRGVMQELQLQVAAVE